MPFDESYIAIIGLGAVTAGYLVVWISLATARRRRRLSEESEKEKRLNKALYDGLATGSITNIDDVVNIYKGISGLTSEDLNYRYGLSNSLRQFLVVVILKDAGSLGESLDDAKTRDWKNKVTEFIKQNEAISPYSDLPSAERNILNDIAAFIDKGDFESVKRKNLELASAIQARNNDFEKIRNMNRWAVPLSIVGFVLTVVFGILAWIR